MLGRLTDVIKKDTQDSEVQIILKDSLFHKLLDKRRIEGAAHSRVEELQAGGALG